MEKNFEVRDKRAKDRFYLDDQYLNGYAKLCGIYSTGVYVSLCRHANLEQNCWPSIKKIAEELAISQTQTRRAIKILEEHKIISKERLGKKLNNRYWLLNKSEWSAGTISDSPDRTLNTSPQDTHPLPDRTLHSKVTHYKVTHSKETVTQSVTGDETAETINLFKIINPSYRKLFGNTTQRAAVSRLLKEHGKEKIWRLIEALQQTNAMDYVPVITTPLQLEDKLGQLLAAIKRHEKRGIQSL